jgi:endonuclease/exonuclease/phosphatase family metal-dependent hydrolase
LFDKEQDIYVNPRHEGDQSTCPWIWKLARRFLRWLGRERLPRFLRNSLSVAEPAGRLTLRGQAEQPTNQGCRVFTIMSANLWHDWPRFKNLEARLEAFARLAEDNGADLLLVQELARRPSFRADAWLADRLQMAYVYSRANGSEKIGFEEGLGVFSRYPIASLPHLRQLSRGCLPFVRRLVLGAAITTPCGEVLAFSAHLGLLRAQNSRQMHDLQHWIYRIAHGRSVLIGGDFNATERSRPIRSARLHWLDTYRMAQARSQPHTHEIHWPWGGTLLRHRLDYIFIQPGEPRWQVVEVRHLQAPAERHSDHFAVLARLMPVDKAL